MFGELWMNSERTNPVNTSVAPQKAQENPLMNNPLCGHEKNMHDNWWCFPFPLLHHTVFISINLFRHRRHSEVEINASKQGCSHHNFFPWKCKSIFLCIIYGKVTNVNKPQLKLDHTFKDHKYQCDSTFPVLNFENIKVDVLSSDINICILLHCRHIKPMCQFKWTAKAIYSFKRDYASYSIAHESILYRDFPKNSSAPKFGFS